MFSPFLSPMPGRAGEYVVNRAGQWESVRWSFYDFQAYAAAGVTQLSFFQTAMTAAGKSLSDTNMALPGQIQQGQMFLVESVEIHFFPTTPTGGATAQLPAAFGAPAVPNLVNDAYVFRRSGNLVFTIGQKPYLQEAPMVRFPPKAQFDVHGAMSDSTTAGASQATRLAMPVTHGRPYILNPDPVLLDAGQNFTVVCAWPEGLQALPSGNPARVGCVLDGTLFRLSQ
jgi:hypothetical protein